MAGYRFGTGAIGAANNKNRFALVQKTITPRRENHYQHGAEFLAFTHQRAPTSIYQRPRKAIMTYARAGNIMAVVGRYLGGRTQRLGSRKNNDAMKEDFPTT